MSRIVEMTGDQIDYPERFIEPLKTIPDININIFGVDVNVTPWENGYYDEEFPLTRYVRSADESIASALLQLFKARGVSRLDLRVWMDSPDGGYWDGNYLDVNNPREWDKFWMRHSRIIKQAINDVMITQEGLNKEREKIKRLLLKNAAPNIEQLSEESQGWVLR